VVISRSRNLRNTCLFTGERARLEVGIWDPDPPVTLSFGGSELTLAGRARRDGRRAESGPGFNDAFRRQLDDFAAAVREGREPAVTAADGRRTIAMLEACYGAREALSFPWEAPPPVAARAAR
jgi:predicted dehydrogenase